VAVPPENRAAAHHIYFDRHTQEAVVIKRCRNLTPGGYLFVGNSESLAGLEIPVESVKTTVLRKPLLEERAPA
jgi:chemotaxis protein methyltransferase CheR